MDQIVNMNEENILNALLEGAGLGSFVFHTHFQLEFFCDTSKIFHERRLPKGVILTILGDWWFGNKEEWDETVKKMTEGFSFVEPDEPVLAFKLAALRWTEGATVSSVTFTSEKTIIMFHCGECISILNKNDCEGDYPWEITECGYRDYNSSWYAVCDEGRIYYSTPITNEKRTKKLIKQYGFDFDHISKDEIRKLIEKETEDFQEGSSEYIRLLCGYLYCIGDITDVPLLEKAKYDINMDVGCMIDGEWIDSLKNGGIKSELVSAREDIIKGFISYYENFEA